MPYLHQFRRQIGVLDDGRGNELVGGVVCAADDDLPTAGVDQVHDATEVSVIDHSTIVSRGLQPKGRERSLYHKTTK